MITNFKIFEELDFPYKVGDYVVTRYSLSDFEKRILNYKFKINFVTIRTPEYSESPYHYSASDIYGKLHHLMNNDILREMTSEEIRQFEIDCASNKFNI